MLLCYNHENMNVLTQIFILSEVVYMIERLACRLGQNDELPNIELAEYLYQHNDTV